MASEKYLKKVNNVQKWIKEYINELSGVEFFGHLLERHLNHSDEKMMRRCAREKRTVTSFVGEEADIINAIKKLLLESSDEISEWLADDDDEGDWILYGSLEEFHVKGKCYLYGITHNWEDGPKECSEFVVVLAKKESKKTLEFVIKSCYPIY